jgi:hypothetical protein
MGRVPVYAPIGGCAYFFDEQGEPPAVFIRVRPSDPNQDCASPITNGDLTLVMAHIIKDASIPEVFSGGRLRIEAGHRVGYLCLENDLPSPPPCEVLNSDVPTHLAVETQRYNGSDNVPANLDVLGFVARPNCVYDDWTSNHPNPTPQPASTAIRACP